MLLYARYGALTSMQNSLQFFVTFATVPAGVIFDTWGARIVAVSGAAMMAVGLFGMIITIQTGSGLNFCFAVLLIDFGSIMQNFACASARESSSRDLANTHEKLSNP